MTHIEIAGLVGAVTGTIDRSACQQARQQVQIGEVVPGRRGQAASFEELLAPFQVDPDCTHVTLESGDGGWSASIERGSLAGGWLLYEQDGEALSAAMGGPFRLFLPGETDACANVKDLARVTFETSAGRDTRPPVEERNC